MNNAAIMRRHTNYPYLKRWISYLLLLQSVFIITDGFISCSGAFSSPLAVRVFTDSKLKASASLPKGLFVSQSHELDGDVTGIQQYDDTDATSRNDDSVSKPALKKENHDDSIIQSFDSVINARYACTRFQRYQEPTTNYTTITSASASISNPSVIAQAIQCLSLAQRAPTGFNAQPYRIILVHDAQQKMALSQYCLGRNADRIRDSDCTAVFLSDEQVGRDWDKFRDFMIANMDSQDKDVTVATEDETTRKISNKKSRTRRSLSTAAMNKMRILILLFSSGYPLPRILSRPFSYLLRFGLSILATFTRWLHVTKQQLTFNEQSTISKCLCKVLPSNSLILPTLSSSEAWAQKNTMLSAMTYMLACTSRGLSTCPMEGFDAQGIRNVLGVPRRFGVPLIVSTGTSYRGVEDEGVDDVGVSHGDGSMSSPRYPMEDVVFENMFRGSLMCPG
eukprot:scaffold17061_cov77-Cyclotella_meneghiniana.AAC.5